MYFFKAFHTSLKLIHAPVNSPATRHWSFPGKRPGKWTEPYNVRSLEMCWRGWHLAPATEPGIHDWVCITGRRVFLAEIPENARVLIEVGTNDKFVASEARLVREITLDEKKSLWGVNYTLVTEQRWDVTIKRWIPVPTPYEFPGFSKKDSDRLSDGKVWFEEKLAKVTEKQPPKGAWKGAWKGKV